MIIKASEAEKKNVGPMIIKEYKINPDFSAALVELNGEHGKIKCTGENRIYFITEGNGEFTINNEKSQVGVGDLVFVPKNTPYNIAGNFKYLLICSPEFKPEDDVFLE